MKNLFLNLVLVAIITTTLVACKDSQKEAQLVTDTEVKAQQQLKEPTNTLLQSEDGWNYTLNLDKSVIYWKGEKPTGSHNGTINITAGKLKADGNRFEYGKFRIDMNSIASNDLTGDKKANLEAHLKGTVEGKEGDFFNVTKHPYALFVTTEVVGDGPKVKIKGNLTVMEVTHEVEFPATISFEKNQMHIKSEAFKIDRTKWGINYGSKSIFDNLGDKFISDDIELSIELLATK